MIERVHNEGFPFEAVGCDTLYGRSLWRRRQLAKAGIMYMADVAASTPVYVRCPQYGRRASQPGRKPFTKPRVVSAEKAIEVGVLIKRMKFERVRVRAVERGFLEDEFAKVSGVGGERWI